MGARVRVPEHDKVAWWLAEGRQAGEDLLASADQIRQSTAEVDRRTRYLDYVRLLFNQEIPDLSHAGSMMEMGTYQQIPDRYNVVESVWDAVQSRIAAKVPRITIQTIGGSRKMRKQAEQLTSFIDGLWFDMDYEDHAVTTHGDSSGFDVGGLKLVTTDRTISCERVFPWEILIDSSDGKRGKPWRMIHEMSSVDLDWAIEAFELNPVQADTLRSQQSGGTVRLTEGWKRATSKGARNGRHIIAAEGVVLLDEVYEKDWFPIELHRWSRRGTGTHGRGLVERTIPYQLELNRMNFSIQEALRGAVPRWVMPSDSLNTEITDQANDYIEYKSGMAAPVQLQGKAMSAEVYKEREQLWARAHEAVGISLLSATGQKPAGLNSGEAQRTYHDIETERFAPHANRWEKFHARVARHMIELARDLYSGKEANRLKVLAPGTKLLKQIDFKDVDLSEDSYVIRPAPVNMLGSTPAARAERLSEMRQSGDIDRMQYLSMVELPDDKAVLQLETAPLAEIEDILERIVDDGQYESPDEHMDLALCVRVGNLYVSQARKEGVAAKRISLLRKFIDDAADLMAEIQAADTAQAQAQQQIQGAQGQVQEAQLTQLQPVGGGGA